MKLSNRTAVVTGGVAGIGLAAVEQFCLEGARVVIGDVSEEQGYQTEERLNGEGYSVTFMKADVSSEADVEALIKKADDTYGSVDILFANAGIGDTTAAHELELDKWNKLMDVNLNGVFLSNKHALQYMLEQENGGAIINNASILGHVGQDSITSYSAAKGAVVNMTRTLGVTYAQKGIRVNAVCPGYVETPLLGESMDKEAINQLAQAHPIGRLAQPEEIAKAVTFLASDDASFMIGSSMMVDGGYTAQ
ncbi:SDR family NAD(P)-dependent oxidoreductase [Salibacterium halotolerans]|uniref:NAD(P)-dependent dehydrogenase, short-chain alcohol dehydrogenase family n=1 Tax=Salibacterium halotolerans TaxID=1884432 RepID=A0A1I5W7T3_9BACI|nr:glucose 1-dehydrogenase [Salibacterium halotolerans]SFQ15810.1 NAD(P)-dependent dehydrogenase, short-chain alcohol dehydrogenase family [Salibacterium halotolerans]